MAVDSSIYAAFAPRQKGAVEYAREFAGLDAARQAQEAGALEQQFGRAKFDEYQRGVQKASALDQLMGSMAGKPEAEVLQGLRGAGRYNEAAAMESSILDRQKKQTDIRKDAGTASKTEEELRQAKRKQAFMDIALFPDAESARASISSKVTEGVIPMQMAQAILQSLPQDPTAFPQWKHELFMKMATPEAQLTAQTTRERDAQTARNNLVGPDGRPNQAVIDAKTRIAAAGAANNVTYGAPVAGRVDGQDVLLQTGNRGGPASVVTTREGRPVAPPPTKAGSGPRLPPGAFEQEQEDLSIINNLSSSSGRIASFIDRIDKKQLPLSLRLAAEAEVRNRTGASTPETVAYEEFNTFIEKLRNDVLMMHKGVQTEGDAIRAMNTIIKSRNDPEIVKAQLRILAEKNAEAIRLKKKAVELRRRNFGTEQIDPNMADAPAPAASPPAAPPAALAAGRTVTRTGTAPDGRKVIQYSDGTVEYAPGR